MRLGAGVGGWECLWGRVRAGVLGRGEGVTPPPPLQAMPWPGEVSLAGSHCTSQSTCLSLVTGRWQIRGPLTILYFGRVLGRGRFADAGGEVWEGGPGPPAIFGGFFGGHPPALDLSCTAPALRSSTRGRLRPGPAGVCPAAEGLGKSRFPGQRAGLWGGYGSTNVNECQTRRYDPS